MGLASSLALAIFNSILFWAAWIIIPVIMEIIPAIVNVIVLARRRMRARRDPKPAIYPEITLIVPVYNSADTLKECIGSVERSTYPDESIHIFLVNNGSTDASFEVYTQCQRLYPNLHMQWLNAEQGKSRALNLALYSSDGKYIIHIDSDGVLEERALENIVRRFEARTDLNVMTGAIMTNPRLIEEYPHGVQRLTRKLEFMEYAQGFLAGRNAASETNMVYTLSGAFSAFRSSAILKSWLYNTETISEDTQITFQMKYLQKEHIGECENAIFYVSPIEDINKLYTQRQRWQRGSLEVAKLFSEGQLNPLKLFTDANMNTLLYDHTFAFPCMIWYLALLCLLFVGYSGLVVVAAVGIIFALYILCGYLFFFGVLYYLKPFPEVRKYYRRQWWVVALLPFFNLGVFFIRFAGIINSIGTDSAWKTRTLTQEKHSFTAVLGSDFARFIAWVKRVRAYVNSNEENEKTDAAGVVMKS